MSGASSLFRQLKDNGIDLIHQLIEEGWQEDLLLDFKTVEGDSAPLTASDRKNFAIALSGFANSDGGIIVWGIDARPDKPNEPDIAQRLQPIKKLKLFVSELQHNTPHLVAPGIVGVEHFSIPKSQTKSDSGFVVTYIPRSESNTHMAMGKNQKRYYYRSGDSFLIMEAFMVADRFGRRARPVLKLDCHFEPASSTGNKIGIQMVIGIKNVGQGIALYPAIAIQETSSLRLNRYGLDGNGRTGIPERPRSSYRPNKAYRFFAGGANDAIHPGTTLNVTTVPIQVFREQGSFPDLTVTYDIFCDGFAYSGEENISMEEYVSQFL
ncbi:MAG: ATP-binding protein [Desulfobacteraceae bacterium]|nr:ATP-binding protein [Desulfobacteraceae bacterium]MBC2751330.1 ATP-binding protein [Desulfobacteraceae bacterium]